MAGDGNSDPALRHQCVHGLQPGARGVVDVPAGSWCRCSPAGERLGGSSIPPILRNVSTNFDREHPNVNLPHTRPLLLISIGVISAVISVPSVAAAHIDPDPTEAQAGSTVSVGFTVEHGCDGSATVGLDMRVPDGATTVLPEPPDGWTGDVTERVVTFEGGPLPDDRPLTFRVRMTLPPTPDTTVYFPFVQRCETGEIRWIDVPTDGSGDDLDEPAPAMQLVGPVAAPAATTSPPGTNPPSTTEPAHTAPTTTTTTPPPTTIAEAAAPPSTTTASTVMPDRTDAAPIESPATETTTAINTATDDSNSGSVVFALVVVAMLVIVGLVALQIRRAKR